MNEKPNTTASGDVARPAGSSGDSLLKEAKQTVGHMAEGAKDQVVTRVESQKDNVADKIGSVAGALRAAGEPLAEMGPLPDLAGAAADKIESIAEYVQSRTIGDLVQEVTTFARREPAIFLGSAFGLGLLAGRFLKSSTRREIHPEIQDDLFEEDIAVAGGGAGRWESQQRSYGGVGYGSAGYGASSTAPGIGSTSGVSTSYGSTGSSVGSTGPSYGSTGSSYGSTGGTGPSYGTSSGGTTGVGGSGVGGSGVGGTSKSGGMGATNKPSDVGSWQRNEGTTTKPMGTIGESTATSTSGPASTRSNGSGAVPRSTGRP